MSFPDISVGKMGHSSLARKTFFGRRARISLKITRESPLPLTYSQIKRRPSFGKKDRFLIIFSNSSEAHWKSLPNVTKKAHAGCTNLREHIQK